MITHFLTAALILALANPSHAKSPERRIQKLVEEGQWLAAGELAQDLLKQAPEDPKIRRQLDALEQRVRKDAENLDFDPKRYFYAQAYMDYFKRQRYADAVDDMEQVLVFELENEEVLRFMDKAQARFAEELKAVLGGIPALFESGKHPEALELARRALALDSSNASAKDWLKKIQSAMAPPPAQPEAPAETKLAMTSPYPEAQAPPPPEPEASIEQPGPPEPPPAQAVATAPAEPPKEAPPPQEPASQGTEVAMAPAPPAPTAAPPRDSPIVAMLPPQARPARPKPALPPPDPEWLESSYREALKAYVHRDLSKSRKILREMLARDPENERWKRTLQRIEKELPQ